MKKKGLIISTIVMVVVLIASLTTATYAWFSASSVTSLADFNVSVTANNDVNIGFDADSSIATTKAALSANNFVTGASVKTSTPTAGALAGSWTGASGLSATITHNINWGAQSKAVAAQHSASEIESASNLQADYESIGTVLAKNVLYQANNETNTAYAHYQINAANYKDATTLENVDAAYANVGVASGSGSSATYNTSDFVYFVLGVQPNGTANLDCNKLCIALDWSSQTGATLGVLASLHVAYRVTQQTGADAVTVGTWQDVDILSGFNSETNATTGVTTNITNGTLGSAPQYATAYTNTYLAAPAEKTTYMMATPIDLSTTIGYIDQVELIIYMDGTDPDCVTSGTTNIAGAVKIFFCTSFGSAS